MSKPKNSVKNIPLRDKFYTPPYAFDLLLPFIKDFKFNTVWESACGDGTLSRTIKSKGFSVIETDLECGVDYFEYESIDYNIQITNPPFSKKYEWLKRAYELSKPFALLMPSDVLFSKAAQELFDKYGYTMLLPNRRIDFKTPNLNWGEGSSQFSSSWFLGNFDNPKGLVFVELNKPSKIELLESVKR